MINIGVTDGILIIQDVNLKEALELKASFELSDYIEFHKFLLYKTVLGYYAGWDCINEKSIYCGTRSEPTSVKQIKEYAQKNSM